jgi:acyl carrier protein
MTPNGKVDRRTLIVFNDRSPEEQKYQPPQNALEAELIQIWQDILTVPQLSTTDSFFELGGNSLSILSLYNRIQARYHADISVADLFSCHTIQMLANRINQQPTRQLEVETTTDLDQRIYDILDNLESGQIDLAAADAALDGLADI